MRGIVLLGCLLALAGAESSAAATIAPVEATWKGVTSDGLPVYFDVAGGRVLNTRFHFRWGFCGTYGSHDPNANLEIDPNGHWAYEDPRGQTFEATFVAPDRAEGRVISVERSLPGCPRTEATFVASPLPPNPESLAAARAGIEALPYAIRLREPRGVENTLIGKVRGSLGETFRFFLFVNRGAAPRIPGVPSYGFHGGHSRIPNRGLEASQLGNTDVIVATVPKRSATEAQEREHYKILGAVEKTVCVRQTGKPCQAP
jgi:hypothetical protein